MVDRVLDLMVTGVDAVISWWSSIMTSTGMDTLYIVILSVVLSMGILLKPILGGARYGLDSGSDRAAKWISERDKD